jgi:energy-coupling factor transporter ATP-binding protein EcfA2
MSVFTFLHPSNIVLAGPSGAGKTHFLVNALASGLFTPTPNRIVWIYSESQNGHEVLNQLAAQGKLPKIEYKHNDTEYEELHESFDPTQTNLLVIDDQMNEGKSNANEFSNIFTKGSHHRSITVVYMMQNLFEKGGSNRTINLNAHYTLVFKNPRDQRQITVLGSQMFPKNSTFLRDAYADATEQPHSYLALDFRQETPEELRVLSKLDSSAVIVYTPSR